MDELNGLFGAGSSYSGTDILGSRAGAFGSGGSTLAERVTVAGGVSVGSSMSPVGVVLAMLGFLIAVRVIGELVE